MDNIKIDIMKVIMDECVDEVKLWEASTGNDFSEEFVPECIGEYSSMDENCVVRCLLKKACAKIALDKEASDIELQPSALDEDLSLMKETFPNKSKIRGGKKMDEIKVTEGIGIDNQMEGGKEMKDNDKELVSEAANVSNASSVDEDKEETRSSRKRGRKSDKKDKIIELLRQGITRKDLGQKAKEIGYSAQALNMTLWQLKKSGKLTKTGDGVLKLND